MIIVNDDGRLSLSPFRASKVYIKVALASAALSVSGASINEAWQMAYSLLCLLSPSPAQPADTVYNQFPATSCSKAAFILGVGAFRFEIHRALAVTKGLVGGKSTGEAQFTGWHDNRFPNSVSWNSD
jgi:hypothetical protein